MNSNELHKSLIEKQFGFKYAKKVAKYRENRFTLNNGVLMLYVNNKILCTLLYDNWIDNKKLIENFLQEKQTKNRCCVCYEEKTTSKCYQCTAETCFDCEIKIIKHNENYYFTCPLCRCESEGMFLLNIASQYNY